MLMNKMNRTSVSTKAATSNASMQTAPKAVAKSGTPMFAAQSTAAVESPANGMSPAAMGASAALLGAGVLIGKLGGGGDTKKIEEQQSALQAQLAQQKASMQAALSAQQAAVAKAMEGKGESAKLATTADLEARAAAVRTHFPTALAVDDFVQRTEIALAGMGFTGDNSIAMTNLCRDESCFILEDKIEEVFGAGFSTHGLGGVLTCGTIGFGAGQSHSPVFGGKEQYIFFSFPHIGIDSEGKVSKISRPNRPGPSSACGAMCACLAQFQADGLDANLRVPGVHDVENPEFSILKQRLARQLKSEGCNPADLDLVKVTQAAERTITNDLEHLISQSVDTKKANYVVITGTQVHNWASDFTNPNDPHLEFVSVGKTYAVIDGVKTEIDLSKVAPLTARQLRALGAPETEAATNGTSVQEIPRGYLMGRLGGSTGMKYVDVPRS